MATRQDRLVRFCSADEMGGLLADFDPKKNLLRINAEMYDLLSQEEQKKLWRVETAVSYEWSNKRSK